MDVMKDIDGQSDGGRSCRSCLSGSARVRKLYTRRRAEQEMAHEPSMKVPATKPRAAWGEDSPVWLADDFLAPTDRYIFGEVDRPTPELKEDFPDRSLVTQRDVISHRERLREEDSRRAFGKHQVRSTDFTRLPRRRRIQFLESLEQDEVSTWPGPESFRRQELRPMRHVTVDRARQEFTTRHFGWSPKEIFRAPENFNASGLCPTMEFEMINPSGPGEIFPEDVNSLRKAVRILRKPEDPERPDRPPSQSWWVEKRSKAEEELKSKKVTAIIKELSETLASGCPEVEDATHLAHLGHSLEEHCYKLRLNQLIPALKLLSRAWKILEAAAEPSVGFDSLIVREHWRRMSKELQISAHFLAEAVSANALTARLPKVTEALQALAESETCCQERLNAQLARLKELFRKDPIHSKDLAKIAGAVGTARLAGAYGTRDFLQYFNAVLLEHLIEFREEEFHQMGWVFPTACMTSEELRQVLARAAEIQVGLRPNSAHCWEVMHHVADFVVEKAPLLHRSLNGFLQLYCRKLREPRETL